MVLLVRLFNDYHFCLRPCSDGYYIGAGPCLQVGPFYKYCFIMDTVNPNRVVSWAETAWKEHKKAEDALVEETKNRLKEIQREIRALESERDALERLLEREHTHL